MSRLHLVGTWLTVLGTVFILLTHSVCAQVHHKDHVHNHQRHQQHQPQQEIGTNNRSTDKRIVATAAAAAAAAGGPRDETTHEDAGGALDEPTSYFAGQSRLVSLFDQRTTFDEYLLYSMRSLRVIAGFDNDLHRYDSKQDLIDSFARNLSYTDDLSSLRARVHLSERGLLDDQSELTLIENELNQAQCGHQLDALIGESQRLFANFEAFSASKQISLIDFLDSFGAPESQLLKGNNMWLGSHEQCSQSRLTYRRSTGEQAGSLLTAAAAAAATMTATKLDSNGEGDEQQQLAPAAASWATGGARYCVAHFRSPLWPLAPSQPGERPGSQAIKLGVCLPESCNSISILRHGQRIETLTKLARLSQVPYSSYKLTSLYCLPDETSPLRQFSLSARVFLSLLSAWLAVVVYMSLKYEYLRMEWLYTHEGGGSGDGSSSSAGFDAKMASDKWMRVFALRLSWSKMFELPPAVSFSRAPSHAGATTARPPASVATVDGLNNKETQVKAAAKLRVLAASGIDGSSSSSSSDGESDGDGSELSAANSETQTVGSDKQLVDALQLKVTTSNKTGGLGVQFERAPCKGGDRTGVDSVVVVNGGGQSDNNKTTQLQHRHQLGRAPTQGTTMGGRPAAAAAAAVANLAAVDGIKVLSMIWLISAHTLLYYVRTIANGRDFWSLLRDARFLTIMAGIFPVDTFFTCTGVLTAYLKFNKDEQRLGQGGYWLEAFFHRYFRFMPMYFIVWWYTRDVSVYLGFGPMWDYATADSSLRSVCKQESALVPLLFGANLKPLDEHCVKPAWYLANDYQFLLVTPLFVWALLKSARLGYLLIGASVCASLAAQFATVFYSAEIADFGVLINFKPLFGTYVLRNLWRLYVLPYNRIPPYLIGLLTGHLMFRLNKSLREEEAEAAEEERRRDTSSNSSSAVNILNSSSGISRKRFQTTTTSARGTINHFDAFKGYICAKVWAPLVFLISIIYLPMSTRLVTYEGVVAKVGTSSIMAVMRLIWSLAIARLIYVCTTSSLAAKHRQQRHHQQQQQQQPTDDNKDNNNKPSHKTIIGTNSQSSGSFVIRLLCSPKWKPWAKIGLTALLIQWEIIGYLAQIQTSEPQMTVAFLLAAVVICVVATYSLALLIYLTIEYPLSQVEQLFIHPMIFKRRSR